MSTPSLKDQILALRETGATYREIVDELQCSKGLVSYYCGVGQAQKKAERQRSRVNAQRRLIQNYKQTRGCFDCGEDYPYWILELDHVRGDKVTDVSRMAGSKRYTDEDILNELAKCEVVCSNCHKNRTWYRKMRTGADALDISDSYV